MLNFASKIDIINMNNIDCIDDLTFVMINKDRIPLPRNQQNEILKIYSEFLFDKVRNQQL